MGNLAILVADDHPIMRQGLRCVIGTQPDMRIVGEASEVHEAIQIAGALQPDIVLMDPCMSNLSGFHSIERLKSSCPGARILFLSESGDRARLHQAIRSGVGGFVLKRASGPEILLAIREVASGTIHIGGALANEVLGKDAQELKGTSGLHLGDLSDREQQVLLGIARGCIYKEIADDLNISAKSVEVYKRRSMSKLNLRSRSEVVQFAVAQGWLNGKGPTRSFTGELEA